MNKKRLFLALPIPAQNGQSLSNVEQALEFLNARWTKKNNFHITLYFIGALEEALIPELNEQLTALCAACSSFSLCYKQLEWAPPEKNLSTMLWATYHINKALQNLVRMLNELLSNYRTHQKHGQIFIPHITLARFKPFVTNHQTMLPVLQIPDLYVSSFILMESQLSHQGSEYFPITHFKLSCTYP